ncbi:MAG: hypothetical protein RLN72_07785 [Henriciella sp.]
MEGFDREALVAKADKSRGNSWFWVAIGALPVIGIAAGLVLGFMPGEHSTKPFVVVEAPQPVTVSPAKAQMVEAAPIAPAADGIFSARAEVRKYSMVNSTLSQCARGGPSEHYYKAGQNYQSANLDKLEKLRVMASNEPYEHDLSAFEKDIPTDPAAIMFQGMTGQLAATALERANQFETMMASEQQLYYGFLGQSPSVAECTAFRNDVVMGKHNLNLS